MNSSKINRNALCPCGSGKKYKQCCLANTKEETGVKAGNAAAQKYFLQALEFHNNKSYEEAVVAYAQGLMLQPDFAEMYSNLGAALDSLGRIPEAVHAYRTALSLKPDSAEFLNNLGLALQTDKQNDEALACFKSAVLIKPDYAPPHLNMGRLLLSTHAYEPAVESYRHALSIVPYDAQARHNLGLALEKLGRLEEAIDEYRAAVDIAPSLISARQSLSEAQARMVPLWHVSMMNDTARNDAYYRALRNAVTPDSHVFEIGTGSGLLALMAAKLGAASVTTCEAVHPIASIAQEIVAANGFSERIEVLSKKSTEVQPDKDFVQSPDIFVSEILSSELLGEHVLPAIEDAKRRLLPLGCKIIPASASIMIALFDGEEIAANLRVDEVCEFDLSAFNRLVPQRQTIARNDLPVRLLSNPIEAFRFDFASDTDWKPETKQLRIPVQSAGRCLGIVQWIRLQLDADTLYENHPSLITPAASWTRCIYLMPTPEAVGPGQSAIVSAGHNRVFPWFSINRIN